MKIFNPALRALFISTALFISCEDEEPTVVETNKLVALAGEDQTVKVNTPVLLDGSDSHDGNKKPFKYSWSVKSKPVGSMGTLSAATSAMTQFTADKAGTYNVQLTIVQGSFSATDFVSVVVTPDQTNDPDPEPQVLNQNIETATTLSDIFTTDDQPDYIVTANIEVRADLTIAPGVVVAFQENKGLEIISGSIRAIGTPENPILLRGVVETPSYWKGILIHSNSDLNEFHYATIRGGGSAIFIESGIRANLALAGSEFSGGAVRIAHTTLAQSGGYGLCLKGRSVVNEFLNNTFSDNASNAAFIPADQLHKLDLTETVGAAVIETAGDVPQGNVTWHANPGGYFLVSGPIQIGGGVTIDSGAEFRIRSGVWISVGMNGYLKAIGTAESRVVFTSVNANTHWNGLYFNSRSADNILIYTEVSYAGLHKIADASHAANISTGGNGLVHVSNSLLQHGLGYGLAAKSRAQVNADVARTNEFFYFTKGYLHPTSLYYEDFPAIAGEWVDYWSFNQNYGSIADNYYNRENGTWFDGASNPWEMDGAKGFGLRVDENGNFTWLIAEQSPASGCESWSAEYITGTASYTEEKIFFDQQYWRSKFINKCDGNHNFDTEVDPIQLDLPYEIHRMYNTITGEVYWELKLINPDNSTFSFYRR